MERYSDRAIEIINELHTARIDYESEYIPLIDCANQCAAYEETGRTPEEVTALEKLFDYALEESKTLTEQLALLNRIRDLAEADKAGRLMARWEIRCGLPVAKSSSAKSTKCTCVTAGVLSFLCRLIVTVPTVRDAHLTTGRKIVPVSATATVNTATAHSRIVTSVKQYS